MKSFKEQIFEANKRFNVLSGKDMEEYIDKLGKSLPDEVVNVINKLIEYNINDESILNRIINSGRVDIKSVSREIGKSEEKIMNLKKEIEDLGDVNIQMIPLFINEDDLKSLLKGDKTIDDIVMDLESEKGRSKIVRQYSNLAIAIASKYRGKCGLDWNSLVSAANMGLVKAMNDYKRNIHSDKEDDKMKQLSFKQYAGWRIRQQILNDINDYSRVVRVTQHGYEKTAGEGRSFSTISIDRPSGEEGDEGIANVLKGLSLDPNVEKAKDNGQMEKIFDMIDKKFPDKTLSIFYSFFGLHGYKKMSGVEIAKQYGVTGAAVSQRVKTVITWLQENRQTRGLLQDLLDIYSESLINTSWKNLDDVVVNDDLFMTIKEAWESTNPEILINRIGECLDNLKDEDALMIEKCILSGDMNMIDELYDSNKEAIRVFCSLMNPISSEQTDVALMEQLVNINKQLKDLDIL